MAVTKYHRLNGLNNRNVCLSSGAYKSKVKVSAGLVPSEAVRDNLLHVSPQASGGSLSIFGVPRLVDIS